MQFTRTMFWGVALSVLIAGSLASAQEKSFKEMIIGAWVITSVANENQNGEKGDNWGGAVKGQVTFGRTGRFTRIIMGSSSAALKPTIHASRTH